MKALFSKFMKKGEPELLPRQAAEDRFMNNGRRSKISEFCDRVLHRLWFLCCAIFLLLVHTTMFILYILMENGSISGELESVLVVGWLIVELFALETVLRLLTSGLLNVHSWSGLLDTTTGAVIFALSIATAVPLPLMLLRLPRLISLIQRTYAIKQFDEELVGRERMGSITSVPSGAHSVSSEPPSRLGRMDRGDHVAPKAAKPSHLDISSSAVRTGSEAGEGTSPYNNTSYFSKAMLSLITDAGSYAGDLPAVRLLQLMYRSVQVGCVTYTPLEKKELRQLMVLLSKNRIYVDRDLQRSNKAYYKEFHGDSSIFLERGTSAGSGYSDQRGSGRLRRSSSGVKSMTPISSSCENSVATEVLEEEGLGKHPRRHTNSGTASSSGQEASSQPPVKERGRRRSLIVNLTKNRSKSPRGQLPNSTAPVTPSKKTPRHSRSLSRRFMRKTTQKSRVESCLLKVDLWDFDVFELEVCSLGNPLLNICKTVFTEERYEFVSNSKIEQGRLLEFLLQIEQGYGSGQEEGAVNKYHNRVHAADVLQSVHFFLTTCGFAHVLTDIEQMALLLAAVVHDYKHPGRSNLFVCKTRGKLAIIYNDISVLENFHISQAMALLQQDRYNFVRYFDDPTYASFRKYMIGLVLATDLKVHFDLLGEFNALTAEVMDASTPASTNTTNIQDEKSEEDNSQMIFSAMKICLKAADIAHPTKNLKLHQKWTDLLAEEFYLQGDEERKLGMEVSSPYCRQSTNLAESQKGFINFLVKPLFASWVKYMNSDDAAVLTENLENNLAHWEELITFQSNDRNGRSELKVEEKR